MISKKSHGPKTPQLDKGTTFDAEIKKMSLAKRLQLESSLGETKAAFVEHSVRDPPDFFNRYIVDYVNKYNIKMIQYVTTHNFRSVFPINLILKEVKNQNFTPFCETDHYENKENVSLKWRKTWPFQV